MNSPSLTIAALMAGMALAATASAQETPTNPTGKAMPQPEVSAATRTGHDASATETS